VRAYRIAYDGTAYHGFQRQPDVATVSDAILDALRDLGIVDEGAVPDGYAAAGRTDAGVSATHQTVAFKAPDWLDPSALNSELPADVRAWASAAVGAGFHATHDATAREYTYYLHAPGDDPGAGPSTPPVADVERVRSTLDRLAGEHDFHNLTPDETGTERDLETDLAVDGPFLVLTLRADGFPRQLVRRLVTVVDEARRGVAGSGRLDAVLGTDPLEGPAGVGPAPPTPLVLTGVTYPGVEFGVDREAAAALREVFEEQRRAHSVRARVARHLRDR